MSPQDDAPKNGRPLKLTPDLALQVAQTILEGNFRYVAGRKYGISPTTLRRWMATGREFPDGIYGQFRLLILESEAEAERLAVKAITDYGKTDDPRLLCWFLERKFPQRWGRLHGELTALRKEMDELRKAVDAPGSQTTKGRV